MSRYLIKYKRILNKKRKMLTNCQNSKVESIKFSINNSNIERLNWMNSLFYLREEKFFTDGIIVTSDHKKCYIDRNIFAAISPYFKALFTNSICPSEPVYDVFLPDISSEIMDILIQFVYTGQLIGVNELNIEEVIQSTDRLQIIGALDYCNQYLIGFYQLSRIYCSPDVYKKAKLFILDNFSIIEEKSMDFLRLSFEEIKDIISDDRLNVSKEEITYESINKWISSNTNRIDKFGELLKQIRFGNSQLKFVESIVSENILIKSNDDLKSYILSVYIVLTDLFSNPIPSKFDIYLYPFLRPRIPRDIIFAFGGWSDSSATNQLETYDCRVNKWFTIETDSPPFRAYHGMVYFNGLVYIIGGFDGRQHFNTVKAFNTKTKSWTNKACMHTARCYVSVALADQVIYAMGGFDGTSRSNTAEKYDYVENQWDFIERMHYQRSDACAASLDGKVYIVGGFNGSEVLSTAEMYNPLDNKWTLISNMNRPRSGVQLVQHKNYIYAIGGNDGNARQSSIERFDPKRNVWILLSNMRTSRSNFTSAVLEDQIYVIGGYNGVTTIAEVESFDPNTNCWQQMWSMNINRSALTAVLVNQLDNGQHYSWLRKEIIDN